MFLTYNVVEITFLRVTLWKYIFFLRVTLWKLTFPYVQCCGNEHVILWEWVNISCNGVKLWVFLTCNAVEMWARPLRSTIHWKSPSSAADTREPISPFSMKTLQSSGANILTVIQECRISRYDAVVKALFVWEIKSKWNEVLSVGERCCAWWCCRARAPVTPHRSARDPIHFPNTLKHRPHYQRKDIHISYKNINTFWVKRKHFNTNLTSKIKWMEVCEWAILICWTIF